MLTAYADADGRLLALDCEATVDSGAYSAYPFSACLEAGQVGSILPGLYDFPHYRCRTYSVATNKPPILPYRGVARTGVCFALEVTLDALARKIGIEPNELRFKSLVRPEQMPFDNIAKRHFDSGDYPEALRRAIEAIGFDKVRERQKRPSRTGAASASASACTPSRRATAPASMPPGASRSCRATSRRSRASRRTAASSCRIGAHSHGQGLETTLSQVAHSILGVPHDRIRLVHGDTAETPYSTGTWGSRCMIMAGGAVAAACDELAARVLKIGAGLLQAKREEVRLEAGEVVGPSGRIAVADVARTWYRRPQDLPPDVDPGGLEVTAGLQGQARHRHLQLCRARRRRRRRPRDRRAGDPRLRRGRGRRHAGQPDDRRRPDLWAARRRASAPRSTRRCASTRRASRWAPRCPTTCCPGPTEVPEIRILHMETPSPYTRFGQKGIGEGGAIAPPAAITNAVNDALAGPRRRAAGLAHHAAAHRRGDRAGGGAPASEGRRRMKPVAFDYARPTTVARGAADAGRQCRCQGAGRRPDAGADAQPAARTTGAARRHHAHSRAGGASARTATASPSAPPSRTRRSRTAASPIPTDGFLARVARGIAYRAVRTRGTIGGSLANADPAADWLSCLSALGAEVVVAGADGSRRAPLAGFVRGAMDTALAEDELLAAVRIPRLSRAARCGFHKICRKTGEFADAIGVAVVDPDRGVARLAASTATGAPIVIEAPDLDRSAPPDAADIERRLVAAGLTGDAYDLRLRAVAVRRALVEAVAP